MFQKINIKYSSSRGSNCIVPIRSTYLNEWVATNFTSSLPIEFKGNAGDVLIWMNEGVKYYLVGMGEDASFAKIEKQLLHFGTSYRERIDASQISLMIEESYSEIETLAILIGLFKSQYAIKGSNEHFLRKVESLLIPERIRPVAEEAQVIAAAQINTMQLLNLPANFKNSQQLADRFKKFADDHDCKITILDRERAQQAGLHAFLAVNQGSDYEGSFTIIEYRSPHAHKTVGLVGKCVTFDTGGVSIKSSTNLHYMKSDMGGACAVLGALEVIAKQQLPVNIIGILPATDNVVSAKAYLPSDVITSHAGKTIEVIDTDAEGRLTLADGLSYVISEYKLDAVIDIATLTGSAVSTFGYECGALFTKNETLKSLLLDSGEEISERLWPLPLWEEYKGGLDSDVADIKNYSGKPINGAIDAGIFLEYFTAGHPAWAHLDIAGVAFGSSVFSKDKSATGYGVHLLYRFIKKLSKTDLKLT